MGKIRKKWELIHNPMTNGGMNGFNQAIENGFTTNSMYYFYFANISQTLFKWVNLPKSMNEEFLENSLFLYGKACAVYDNITQEIYNLNYTENSYPSMYNMPKNITAYSNGYNKNFKSKDFVICRNNKLYVPTCLYANYFAGIVQDIDLTLRNNLKAQKTPVVFSGSKEQQLQIEQLFQKYDGNNPYIFLKEGYEDLVKLSCFKTDAPFIADKLTEMKKDYKNEFLSFLGVNNVDTEKKERLIQDEVNANNHNISLNFETMFSARKAFCKEFNEKFAGYIDAPISVEPSISSVILSNDKKEEEAKE